jgi:hypothetical protein
VTKISIQHGRTAGVQVHDQLVRVRRAVLADVAAEHLYGRLVTFDELPSKVRAQMAGFRRDPATFKVDWALSTPVPWRMPPPYPPGTVHIADSYEELVISFAELSAGSIPKRPFLLIGQMTTSDPTRSPEGTESMWAYTHVPLHVLDDAGGNLTGSWDADEAERFADRMQDRIEQRAPGFSERIIARRILTPLDMERRNASLVGGSLNGGTTALDQQLIFRPIPGLGRANTPIRGLYLASSSAHPGGAVHGACGMNAARAALAYARLTPRISARGRAQVSAEPDRSPDIRLIMVAAFGEVTKPPQRLTVAEVDNGLAYRLRNQPRRAAAGVFRDRDRRAITVCLDGDLYSSLANRPSPSFQHQPLARLDLKNLGTVVDQQRPYPERVVQLAARRRPASIDVAYPRCANHPKGIAPPVVEDVEHIFW